MIIRYMSPKFMVIGLLGVSIGFGYVKQVKSIGRSWEAVHRPARDAGSEYLPFKDYLLNRHGPAARDQMVVYETDRVSDFSYRGLPSQKPGQEYFYDCQYAFIPIFLHQRLNEADYMLLDYASTSALEERLAAGKWVSLLRKGNIVLIKGRN